MNINLHFVFFLLQAISGGEGFKQRTSDTRITPLNHLNYKSLTILAHKIGAT